MKSTYISWVRHHRNSELLAQNLGASMHYFYVGQAGRPWGAVLRYVVQSWQTWKVLRCERPDAIIIQNPPISCVLLIYLYTRLHGGQYIIDSHTGAFTSWKWRWSLGLHRWLSARALSTIVHNESQAEIVKDWGCRYCVLGYRPGTYPAGEPYPLNGHFNVVVSCSFLGDEPVDVVFEAASGLEDICFYVTGDYARLDTDTLAAKPNNCYLTGYIPYEQYVGLLREADAVMALTRRNDSLLMGALEAVALRKPAIVSDSPILRAYFSLGTIHVSNSAEGVRSGVRQVQQSRATLQQEMALLRDRLQVEWEEEILELQALLQGNQESRVGNLADS